MYLILFNSINEVFLFLQYYDKKNESPRRTLLFHNASSSGYGNKTKQQASMMVQSPCDDIYLCDNCDAEFIDIAKMKVFYHQIYYITNFLL